MDVCDFSLFKKGVGSDLPDITTLMLSYSSPASRKGELSHEVQRAHYSRSCALHLGLCVVNFPLHCTVNKPPDGGTGLGFPLRLDEMDL